MRAIRYFRCIAGKRASGGVVLAGFEGVNKHPVDPVSEPLHYLARVSQG